MRFNEGEEVASVLRTTTPNIMRRPHQRLASETQPNILVVKLSILVAKPSRLTTKPNKEQLNRERRLKAKGPRPGMTGGLLWGPRGSVNWRRQGNCGPKEDENQKQTEGSEERGAWSGHNTEDPGAKALFIPMVGGGSKGGALIIGGGYHEVT